MKASVITICYNCEKTIETTILSVKNQTYEYIEYIIVDGQSKDNTLDIIKRLEPQFNGAMHWISEPDKGIYDAMNKGIRMAKGDVIGILNSDDLYKDEFVVEKVMSEFKDDAAIDMLYGDLVYVKRNDINKIVRIWRSKPYFNLFFELGNVPPHPSLFVKKSVYETVELFNLDFELAADYEFMLRLFKMYNLKSAHLPEVFVKMRLGGATSKNWKNRIKQNKEILRAWGINNLKPPIYFFPIRVIKKLLQFV